MKVLVACEFSGTVRDAFLKVGAYALSCDLLPSEKPGPHYLGDILGILSQDWDVLIAHPPCTYLANSGVQHLHKDPMRWVKLKEACEFFNMLLDCHIGKKCVENPIPHKYAVDLLKGRKYSQLIQPYQFGHPERKATCLWLENLPELQATNDVKQEMLNLPKNKQQRLHFLPPSEARGRLRSVTFLGIATAMAEQWGPR